MKLTRIFIVFTFLLALASNVPAQTPQIVWKNLQEKYEMIEDVNLVIVNDGTKPLFLVATFYKATLLRLDKKTNQWRSREMFICGTGVKPSFIKLKPQNKISVDFDKDGWALNLGKPSPFMPPAEPQPLYKGKYKLQLYYGLKSSEIELVSFSPEFEVVEYARID